MKIVRNGGFSLVELMITLLVLAVLVTVAAPALTNLIKDNRMLSQVYAMRAALNNARSKALSERTFVTVCSSDDGASCGGAWNEGYIAFTDREPNGVVNDPNDPDGDTIIVSEINGVPTQAITYSAGLVRFNSQGYATNTAGTFTICDDRGDSVARGLIISQVGAVRAAVVDPNDPGSDNLAACP